MRPHRNSASLRRLGFLACIGLLFASAAWIHWLADRSSAVSFLPGNPGAEWIVYPKPPVPHRQAVAELPAFFRCGLNLNQPPTPATLRVRFCRGGSVVINGKTIPLPSVREWKDFQQIEVSSFLVHGENSISITVSNPVGPPALWLSLTGPGLALRSDGSWETSYAGAIWERAQLARSAPPVGPGNPLTGGEKTFTALRDCWPLLGGFALAAVGLVVGGTWWFKRAGDVRCSSANPGSAGIPAGVPGESASCNPAGAPALPGTALGRLANRWRWVADPAAVMLCLIMVLWVALTGHNLSFVPRSAGFDTDGHLEYVKYIQQHKALPLADEGWEMHQPPLYYLLCATALNIFGLSASSFDGLAVLRLLSLAIGLAHLGWIFGSLRLLFPGQPAPQAVGVALAGFLPMQLYLNHYITNESLSACLMSATFYFLLKCLRSEPSHWAFPAIGLCLGLALLTKLTALILVPLVAAALLYRVTRQPSLVTLAVLVCLGVCGWHYWRVWRHFGHALFPDTRWAFGASWWQDPGYRTAAYFSHFGRAITDPFFSGLASFNDGIYSTLWGDGLCGGMAALRFRPPWNYELMASGFLLALLPTVLVLAGLVVAGARLVRGLGFHQLGSSRGEEAHSDPPQNHQSRLTSAATVPGRNARIQGESGSWLAVLVLGFILALALVHQNLVVPAYAEAKAVFALSGVVVLCALAGAGWDWLARKARPLAPIASVLFALWAMTSYASFWVQSDAPSTQALVGRGLMRDGNYPGAIAHFNEALQRDPSHLDARSFLTATLLAQNRLTEAADLASRTATEHPGDALCQMDLATVLEAQGQLEGALEHTSRAVELAPDDPEARLQLAVRLFKLRRLSETIAACRQALRLWPADPEVHLVLAFSLLAQADDSTTRDAISHLRIVVDLAPDSPDALDRLAWILATHPNSELRDGPEAVRLAERACALTDNRNPNLLDTLAAARAEAGQYAEAIATTEKVEKLLQASPNPQAQQRNQRLSECFRAGRPFRQPPP